LYKQDKSVFGSNSKITRFTHLSIVFFTLLSVVKAGPKNNPKPAPNPVCSPPIINVS
jgi:hypothetical protein